MKSRLLKAMIASTKEEGRWIVESEDETLGVRGYALKDSKTLARIRFVHDGRYTPAEYICCDSADGGLNDREFQEFCGALVDMIGRRKEAERKERDRLHAERERAARAEDEKRRAELRSIMEEAYL